MIENLINFYKVHQPSIHYLVVSNVLLYFTHSPAQNETENNDFAPRKHLPVQEVIN